MFRAIILGTIFFHTTEADFEFVAFGDWGYAGPSFDTVMKSFQSQCPKRDFVMLLGDKYPQGFKSVNDLDWSLFTEGVAKDSTIPHHVVLGNHDYLGNIDAEIEYSRLDSRWDLPSKFYTRVHSDDSTTICIYAIDTNDFHQTQMSWLNGQFVNPNCESSKAWNIVIGHHPIWTAALYKDSPQLKEDLLPILHKHKVDLYLCGHDHVHEIFYDGTLTEVVSGAVAVMRAPVTFSENANQIWGVSGWNVEGYLKITTQGSSGLHVEIKSARSNLNFQEFTITKNGDKSSIFGHVNWSRENSNKDAVIADGGNSKSATCISTISAAAIILLTIITYI